MKAFDDWLFVPAYFVVLKIRWKVLSDRIPEVIHHGNDVLLHRLLLLLASDSDRLKHFRDKTRIFAARSGSVSVTRAVLVDVSARLSDISAPLPLSPTCPHSDGAAVGIGLLRCEAAKTFNVPSKKTTLTASTTMTTIGIVRKSRPKMSPPPASRSV